MEKEVFDKNIIQEAQQKLAEKRAKQNELDSIKSSVKMISDAVILLNSKMESLKNSNLKSVEDAVANFEEIADYHSKKIDNYDNNFNIIKRKINSFNDVAADMLNKIKNVCESLEINNIQELSKETEEYADIIKNKIKDISLEFDSLNDVRLKIEQINENISSIESYNINGNINALYESIEKIKNFADVFEGNISYLDNKVNDAGLIDKAEKKIKSFDKVYDSVDSILEKTEAITENIKSAENTVSNICKYNEEQNNNIQEVIQNKFSLLSQIILEISEKILNEKNQIEIFVNQKYDYINENLNKISSEYENNTEVFKNIIENNSNDIVENIKNVVSDSNTFVEESIKSIVDIYNNTLRESISEKLEQKFKENKNITNEFRQELKVRYNALDELINTIKSDSSTSDDAIKNIITNNYEKIIQTINNMSESQDETINKINELLIENFGDALERIHDVVCKNEKKYSCIIEKIEQLSESMSILDKNINKSLENNFKDIYDKLNYLIDENIRLQEQEEKKYKNLNEKFERFSFDTTKNFKKLKGTVDELCIEIPKQVNSNFKELFSELDDKLNDAFNNQYKKIETNIEGLSNNIIDKDEFNKKFEKLNNIDDKICELEQKINNLLEENKSLKEIINQNNQRINQHMGSNINNNSKSAGINNTINLLEKSANNGDIRACLQLGDMYYKGLNTNQDLEKALKYYEIGSRNGSTECNSKIIMIYSILAEKGLVKYQILAGKSYLEGKIIKQDLNKALIWYKKAAINGNVEAKAMLIRLYTMMANNNNPDGLYNLGMCYYEGFCVQKDLVKAYEYLNRAASLGHADAIKKVN
ncbi:tetratricopeptide repeat protein [Clostridium sp. SM-530-WT-3G]|uniref:tetratricopeptide repeat protein n=1 Tax=Clostridium sp. SM-530-WT-3G TaxID=2725303 RepID=UPI00145DE982|nr:hypothetical protein [Clostridium sp. SM-530-WT-3G]